MTESKYRVIEFYKKSSGKVPVEDYLNELPFKVRKKILFIFALIEELQIVPSKYWQKMAGSLGLWEARIEYESNIYRFLGFMHKGKLIVLTNGFQKKSQKSFFAIGLSLVLIFCEVKNKQKQQLALWHYGNRLVPKNDIKLL